MFPLQNILGQSAPIQNGLSTYSGDLYHLNNVGIGLNNPDAQVHILVPENKTSSTPVPFKIATVYSDPGSHSISYIPYFVVNATGNVGIGTDNPTTLLEVDGDTKVNGVLSVDAIAGLTSTTTTFTGDAQINGTLTVEGLTNLENLTVAGDLTSGSATIAGNTDILGDLSITGNIVNDPNVLGNLHITNGGIVFTTDDGVSTPFNTLALHSNGNVHAREVRVDLGIVSFPRLRICRRL